jgi:cyclopropane fatty-acyl-phospholipid synthase-like methyltransferase
MIYDKEYFKKRKKPPFSIATKELVEEIMDRYNPESVIDVGCAIGFYLKEFKKYGVSVRGVEGSRKAVEMSVVDSVRHADLREPVCIPEPADFVLSIEVAEHIHEIHADNLIDTVTDAVVKGGHLMITAAPPGQPGRHHVNLKPHDYWIDKIEKRGFIFKKIETEEVRKYLRKRLSKRNIDSHFLYNIMIFKK